MLRRDQGAVCSPSVHECCTSGCRIQEAQHRGDEPCGGQDNECLRLSFCDGEHYVCPTPQEKPNGTLCQGMTRVGVIEIHVL